MTAVELRMKCEIFVDDMTPYGISVEEFDAAVDDVFRAMEFLIEEGE